MPLLVGIDLETTGLDPQIDSIIEVGMVLWDTESCGLLKAFSSLVMPEFAIPAEVTHLTGIDQHMTMQSAGSAIAYLQRLCEGAVYMVAHNADFEKSFLKKHGFTFPRWIDTKTDLPYPPSKGEGPLNSILMNHGLFNPMPHRALTDALAMMQLLSLYDFREVERLALAENIKIGVSFGYDKDMVDGIKARGYHWVAEGKFWRKSFKDFQVNTELEKLADLGYNGRILEKEEGN